jgi:hypothetical protein
MVHHPYRAFFVLVCAALLCALLLFAATTTAQAQPTNPPSEFPPEAQPLGGDALQQRLAGKVLKWKLASGRDFRLQLDRNGWGYINVNNDSDTGRWTVEPDKACWKWRKFGDSCNEFRGAGEQLWIKMNSGEVAKVQVD